MEQPEDDGAGGWTSSAAAWIADMGEAGGWGRRAVLDGPMLARVRLSGAKTALDVGCGEGRFCRMLRAEGIAATGIDPTEALIAHARARARDPEGGYRLASAEALPFADESFDLVVAYLSVIDIPDIEAAIAEMARVLKLGGRLLIANLTPFNTAGLNIGWTHDAKGRAMFGLDRYLEECAAWCEWRGIRVQTLATAAGAVHGALAGAGADDDLVREAGTDGGGCGDGGAVSAGAVVSGDGVGEGRVGERHTLADHRPQLSDRTLSDFESKQREHSAAYIARFLRWAVRAA